MMMIIWCHDNTKEFSLHKDPNNSGNEYEVSQKRQIRF